MDYTANPFVVSVCGREPTVCSQAVATASPMRARWMTRAFPEPPSTRNSRRRSRQRVQSARSAILILVVTTRHDDVLSNGVHLHDRFGVFALRMRLREDTRAGGKLKFLAVLKRRA